MDHPLGLPEPLLYSLLFALNLSCWHRKPGRALNIVALISIVMIFAMGALGYLSATGLLG